MGTDKRHDYSKGLRAKRKAWRQFGHFRNETFTVIIEAERGEWTMNREQAGWAPLFFLLPVA